MHTDSMDAAPEPADLDQLLHRSQAFADAMRECLPSAGLVMAQDTTKHELVSIACELSIEHAVALRLAFAAQAPNSGTALLRLQFESLLRAAWLLFAASDSHVDRLTGTLDLQSEQAAKNLPGYLDMLDVVAKSAPLGLSAPLVEFNQYSRHALNSYVHGGIHPLTRTKVGYPVALAVTCVRFSNGLSNFAHRLLAQLTGSQRRMDRVTHVYLDFLDCVPMKGSGTT